MKKLLSLLLVLIMLFVLAACDSKKNEKNDKKTEKTVNLEKTGEGTENSADGENAEEVEVEEISSGSTVKEVEIPLIKNDNCVVKVTEIEPDYEFGYRLGLNMENNSDVTLYFTTENTAVDSLAIPVYFGEEVAPGECASGEIVFRKENCEAAGVIDYSDILLALKIYDYDDSQNVYAEEIVHVYPDGEDKAAVYKRKTRRGDDVLINESDLKLTLIDFDKDEYYVFANVYIENNSNEEVYFSCKDVSVNDNMISTSFYVNLLPGTSGYAKISWANSALEESNIDRVRYVNLTLYARPADIYDNIFEKTFFLRA